eukprot:Opistho-2@56753
MRRLCKEPVLNQLLRDLVRREMMRRVQFDGIQQPLATHILDPRVLHLAHPLAELLSQFLRALGQLFVAQDLECFHSNAARKRIAAICRSVLARLDAQHDLVVAQDCRDRHESARQRLPENENVRTHALVVAREHAARAAESRLDLVGNKQHIGILADLLGLAQIPLVRHNDARLALDRLNVKAGYGRVLHGLTKRVEVVVRDDGESGSERSKTILARGVRRGRHSRCRAPPEVALGEDDFGLVMGHSLCRVRPLARELDGRFAALGASVHGQHLVVAEKIRDEELKYAQLVTVESTRRERQLLALIDHGLYDPRMAVALINGRVGAQKVKIALSLDVVQKDPLATLENGGKRGVVVRTALEFERHVVLGCSRGPLAIREAAAQGCIEMPRLNRRSRCCCERAARRNGLGGGTCGRGGEPEHSWLVVGLDEVLCLIIQVRKCFLSRAVTIRAMSARIA